MNEVVLALFTPLPLSIAKNICSLVDGIEYTLNIEKAVQRKGDFGTSL